MWFILGSLLLQHNLSHTYFFCCYVVGGCCDEKESILLFCAMTGGREGKKGTLKGA